MKNSLNYRDTNPQWSNLPREPTFVWSHVLNDENLMRNRLLTALIVTAHLAVGFAACQQAPEGESGTTNGADETAAVESVENSESAAQDDHAEHNEHADPALGAPAEPNAPAGDQAAPTNPANAEAGSPELAAASPVVQPGAQIGDLTNCPVCDAEFTLEERHTHFDHAGETYYFCCPHCLGEFRDDPGPYVN